MKLGWATLLILACLAVGNDIRLKAEQPTNTTIADAKEISSWMRGNLPQDVTVMVDDPLISYDFFTGVQHSFPVPYAEYDPFIRFAQKNRVEYIVLSAWSTADWNTSIRRLLDEESTSEELVLVKTWQFDDGEHAKLFKVLVREPAS